MEMEETVPSTDCTVEQFSHPDWPGPKYCVISSCKIINVNFACNVIVGGRFASGECILF